MKRDYQVFYILKANRHVTLNHMFVRANNAKEAKAICWEQVMKRTGRNAFDRLAIRTDDENGQEKVYRNYGETWVKRQMMQP